MTVGRFLRTLGYLNFDELRREVSRSQTARSWRVGDRYEQFTRSGACGAAGSSFDREVEALIAAYELASGDRWKELVKRIATTQEVYVAGFQTVRGVAMDFAARLEYLREGVRLLDGVNGTYAELFARSRVIKRCVVIVDIRRYARQAQLLAKAALQAGIPAAIVTDAQCHWARTYTDDVFHVTNGRRLVLGQQRCHHEPTEPADQRRHWPTGQASRHSSTAAGKLAVSVRGVSGLMLDDVAQFDVAGERKLIAPASSGLLAAWSCGRRASNGSRARPVARRQ